MRLDHIAYQVRNRHETAKFFVEAFNYKIHTEFDINFDNDEIAHCLVLEPPEKIPTRFLVPQFIMAPMEGYYELIEYHLAPELFVVDGSPNSIVGKWVANRSNVGGIHHIAYQVKSVQSKVDEWKSKGYSEFASETPLTCPGLKQIFTKPSQLTGVIYEFIEREKDGFCRDNVKELMISTDNFQ